MFQGRVQRYCLLGFLAQIGNIVLFVGKEVIIAIHHRV